MNGKLVPFKDAKVHVLTHALHYSTAVFEGIRCYNTPKGSMIFRLPEHVDRLFKSAKMYSMKLPYSKNEISKAIIGTVKASKLKECYIRPIAYYGYGVLGLTPTPNKIDLAIACWEWKLGESSAGISRRRADQICARPNARSPQRHRQPPKLAYTADRASERRTHRPR